MQGGGPAGGNGSPETTSRSASHLPFHRRAAGWIWSHKFTSFLLLLLALIAGELAGIPWFAVSTLKTQNPSGTALMRQREEEAKTAGKPYRIVQKWVPLSRIPKPVVDAIIVAEDGTFYTHGGVDWFEVRESLEKDIEEGRAARGGSTITQQVAKNLFLSTSKDPVRKLKELIITFLLEKELGKERILEIYLNIVEWGSGVYGIEAASEAYFGIPAASLTLDQAARLAAVIPSPLRHRPDGDGRYVLRRRGIVLGRMQARNMIGMPAGDSSTAAIDSAGMRRNPAPVTPAAADSTGRGDTTETEEGEPNGL